MSLSLLVLLTLAAPPADRSLPLAESFVQQTVATVEFADQEAGFAVKLPGEPTKSTRTLTVEGVETNVRLYQVQTQSAVYLIASSVYPNATDVSAPDALIDRERDSFVRGAKAEVRSEEAVKGLPYPCREVKVAIPGTEAEGTFRIHLVDRRLYIVAAMGLNQALSPLEAGQVLESFQARVP